MCPDCREPLVAFQFGGVEIDRCVECRGTWLDAGELETILRLSGANPGAVSGALRQGPSQRSTRRCPRCRRRLRMAALRGREGRTEAGAAPTAPAIEADRCPAGHGLWLDAGEMEAVVKAFTAPAHTEEEATVARFFSELYRHDLSPGLKGE